MMLRRIVLSIIMCGVSSAPCFGMEVSVTPGMNVVDISSLVENAGDDTTELAVKPATLLLNVAVEQNSDSHLGSILFYGGITCASAFVAYCGYRYYNSVTKAGFDRRIGETQQKADTRLNAAREVVDTQFGRVETNLEEKVRKPLIFLNGILTRTGQKMTREQAEQLERFSATFRGDYRARRAARRQYNQATGGLERLLVLCKDDLEKIEGKVTTISGQLDEDEQTLTTGLSSLNKGMAQLVKATKVELQQRLLSCQTRLLELDARVRALDGQAVQEDQVAVLMQEYEAINAEKDALLARIELIEQSSGDEDQEGAFCAQGASGSSGQSYRLQ